MSKVTSNDLVHFDKFFLEPTTLAGSRRHSVFENDTEMDTRSPTELGRQRSTGPMLTSSEISALLAQNAETSQLLKSQNELIKTLLESQNALVNKQTELEEKLNKQERSLSGYES